MGLSYFGKLSTRADFVRSNASSAAFRSMDTWIQEGLLFLQGQRIDRFEEHYDSAGPSCFVLNQFPGTGSLLGAIRPSRDLSGRKYPFFIASELNPDSLSHIPAAHYPFEFHDLFSTAASLVDDSVSGMLSSTQLDERLQENSTGRQSESDNAPSIGLALADLSFGEFCTRLWGSFRDSRKYATFKHLIDILVPVQGNVHGLPGYGLQFPLLAGEDLETSIAFWLDACSRFSGVSDNPSSVIWNTRNRNENDGPSLYLSYSRTPPSVIVHILQVSVDLDSLFRVDSLGGGNAAEMALSIPEEYGRLIETEDISLRHFLEALS